jgi:hypothetical protein
LSEEVMSQNQAEEALKNFFESALTPDKDDDEREQKQQGENAGVIKGLKVTLMKHQIEGLEFLHEQESDDKTKKGKRKYGGILADDVPFRMKKPKLTIDGLGKDYSDIGVDTYSTKGDGGEIHRRML